MRNIKNLLLAFLVLTTLTGCPMGIGHVKAYVPQLSFSGQFSDNQIIQEVIVAEPPYGLESDLFLTLVKGPETNTVRKHIVARIVTVPVDAKGNFQTTLREDHRYDGSQARGKYSGVDDELHGELVAPWVDVRV